MNKHEHRCLCVSDNSGSVSDITSLNHRPSSSSRVCSRRRSGALAFDEAQTENHSFEFRSCFYLQCYKRETCCSDHHWGELIVVQHNAAWGLRKKTGLVVLLSSLFTSHGSCSARISTLTSHSSVLPSYSRKRFQSLLIFLKLHNWSVSFVDKL